MGANMVRRLMKGGHTCVVYDRNADAVKELVGEGLSRAKEHGFAIVLLVGDMPYYGRFGFAAGPAPL